MTLKYDFNITTGQNAFISLIDYLNSNTKGFLINVILLMIFFISLYVINKYTDDMELSFAYSLFAIILIATLFYYLGFVISSTLFSGYLLMAMILLEVITVGLLFYSRNKIGGD